VGTIFHHTHLPLNKWFLALSILLNSKKAISNAQLGRDLGLPYKTAWSLASRIRSAMLTDAEQKTLFKDIVETDATRTGAKPRKGGPTGGEQGSKTSSRTKRVLVRSVSQRRSRAGIHSLDQTVFGPSKLEICIAQEPNLVGGAQ
jgi:hypothetical protein